MNLTLKAKCGLSLLIGLGLSLWLGVSVAQAQCPNDLCYVDANGTSLTPDGISWTSAYTNLQDALAVAQAGDEIWVAAGVYYPDEGGGQTDNDVTASFALTDGVKIYGGFAGTETERSQRQPRAKVTVLSGDIDGNDGTDGQGVVTTTNNISGTNAYHVIFNRGVSRTAVLDGFTITAGQANVGSSICPDICGGRMYNIGSSPQLTQISFSGNRAALAGGGMVNENSSPQLTQISFSGNSTVNSGGGMYNHFSNPEMSQVSFSGNSADDGGGMFNENSSPQLTQISFSGNFAADGGGGMVNWNNSNPEMSQVSFSGNSANLGGGMINGNSSPQLTQISFSGNRAALAGGGMFNENSSPQLTQISFSGNSADDGGGMFNQYSSQPHIVNSIFWGNAASGQMNAPAQIYNSSSYPVISYTLIQRSGGSSAWEISLGRDGGHNLDADPLFREPIDPADAPTSAGNLRLRAGSPAIDAGDDRAASGPQDLDGATRIIGAGVDLGAYETGPGISLSKTVSPVVVEPDQRVTYTLVLSNSGLLNDSVRLSDPLPSGVEFVAWVAQGGAVENANEISWHGTVTAEESITITFGVSNLNLSGPITNMAQFSGSVQTGSTSVSHTVTEEAIAGLRAQNSSPAALNEVITFTAHITAGTNVSYTWQFGDGGRAVGQEVSRVYTQAGTYTVRVVASNSTNTMTATTVVSITPIERPEIDVTDYLSPDLRLENFTAYQGVAYSYTVKVSPSLMRAQTPHLLETQIYTLSAPHKPAWLDFVDHQDNTGTLRGVPGAADQGEQAVTILARDGQVSSTAVFTITVGPNQVYLPLVLR